MTDSPSSPDDFGPPYLPGKKVRERYSITDRTLDRWVADPEMKFPDPIIINNRRYWSEPQLVVYERKRVGQAA